MHRGEDSSVQTLEKDLERTRGLLAGLRVGYLESEWNRNVLKSFEYLRCLY